MIIQELRDVERSVYIQTICRLKNNERNKRILEEKYNSEPKYKQDSDWYIMDTISSIKDEGDFLKYFIKLLKSLGVKYEQTKQYLKNNENTNNEIEKNFTEAWFKFFVLYKIFEDKDNKNIVFISS